MKSLPTNLWHEKFLELMADDPIDGLYADFFHYQQDGVVIPVSCSVPIDDNCYAVTPLTLITGYAQEELPKINNMWVRRACYGLIKMLTPILKLARLNRVQTLNNQCLSTNMYSEEWQELNTESLRLQALRKEPTVPLQLRSLNNIQHGRIIERLNKEGWIALVTRQVYLHVSWDDFVVSRDFKRDLKLLEDQSWQYKELSTSEEFDKAKELYDMLYLKKYSQNNIRYTSRYMEQASKKGLIKFIGIFHKGELLAFFGIVVVGNSMTCPMIGYETGKPRRLNLYRRISVYIISYAWHNKLQFNMSSGAPSFKRNRKARPCIECSYIYIQHLPLYQRAVWRLVTFLADRIYRPLLIRYKL